MVMIVIYRGDNYRYYSSPTMVIYQTPTHEQYPELVEELFRKELEIRDLLRRFQHVPPAVD